MIDAVSLSEWFDLRIRQTLIVGIGLDSRGKEQIASTAAPAGRLPTRVLLYNQLEELRNEEWTGLLSIAVAILCFDPNREQQFEKARKDLNDSDLSSFKKPSEALAHIFALHQRAVTAFGKDFMTMYDLFTLVKSKLHQDVLQEVDELMVTSKAINQLDCDWEFIDDVITQAWLNHSRRPGGYYTHTTNANPPNADNPPTIHAALHPSAHDSLSDIHLK